MAPIALEAEDHSRDAAFNKAMHGKLEQKGFRSMISKDHDAHKAAADEYFKHWDDKCADTETMEIREVRFSLPMSLEDLPLRYDIGAQAGVCYLDATVRHGTPLH